MTKVLFDGTPERSHEGEGESGQAIRLPAPRGERSRDAAPKRKITEPVAPRLAREPRLSIPEYLRQTSLVYILAAPFIYGMIIPLLILDISATLYQHLCFRIWGIPRLRRLDYLLLDRHHLTYLNVFEKLHCVYCAYATQLMEYAREINARTEQFFCPIKHARRSLKLHDRSERFFGYGDAKAYARSLETMRRDWSK